MSARYKHLGFTGTRRPITDAQTTMTRRLVAFCRPEVVHHGCCVGGDEMFHNVCEPFEMTRWLHPPFNPMYQAKLKYIRETDMQMPKLAYEDRNQEIVGMSDALIACPKEFVERIRSGTWMTVRYARMVRMPIYIVFPNGDIRQEYVRVENKYGGLF